MGSGPSEQQRNRRHSPPPQSGEHTGSGRPPQRHSREPKASVPARSPSKNHPQGWKPAQATEHPEGGDARHPRGRRERLIHLHWPGCTSPAAGRAFCPGNTGYSRRDALPSTQTPQGWSRGNRDRPPDDRAQATHCPRAVEDGESLRCGRYPRHRPAGESASGPALPSRPGSLQRACRGSNTA